MVLLSAILNNYTRKNKKNKKKGIVILLNEQHWERLTRCILLCEFGTSGSSQSSVVGWASSSFLLVLVAGLLAGFCLSSGCTVKFL